VPTVSPKTPIVLQLAIVATLSVVSIGLVTVTDQMAASILPAPLKVIAYIRIPSVLLCFTVWLVLRQTAHPIFSPQTIPWRSLVIPAALWLIPTAILTLGHVVWVPQISGATNTIAFMVTGLLAEEFLFRGALYDQYLSLPDGFGGSKTAIICSATLFGCSHLQYHHFVLTTAAGAQILYTIVLGVLLGIIRERSESIVPGIFVHMTGNAFVLLAAHL
jgi:membrane protease YdiL (CAAX protease family)